MSSSIRAGSPSTALKRAVALGAAAWGLANMAFQYEDGALSSEARDSLRQKQTNLDALIADASDEMEACIDAGRAKEARAWVEALDEMRRVSEAAGVAARLVKVEGAP